MGGVSKLGPVGQGQERLAGKERATAGSKREKLQAGQVGEGVKMEGEKCCGLEKVQLGWMGRRTERLQVQERGTANEV